MEIMFLEYNTDLIGNIGTYLTAGEATLSDASSDWMEK